MKFSNFIENFKKKLHSLKETIINLYKENKKITLIIAVLFFAILISIIILINYPKKEKNIEEQNIVLTEELIIPKGPELPKDYNINRKNKENWNKEDSEKWFTIPTEKEIEDLSKSNDKMIEEIIGVAP